MPARILPVPRRGLLFNLKQPAVIGRLAVQGGNELIGSTPMELIRSDIALYGRIIRAAGIKAEQACLTMRGDPSPRAPQSQGAQRQ